MVGWLVREDRRGWRTVLEQQELAGLRILRAGMPWKLRETARRRRLNRAAVLLVRSGVRRVLTAAQFPFWESLTQYGLHPVNSEPFCQALAAPLALAALARQGILPAAGTVALAGRRVNRPLFQAALTLCPQVRTLVLDVPTGGAELADDLRREFGVAALTAGTSVQAQVVLAFSPGETPPGSLHLWGQTPDLNGFQLTSNAVSIPPELDILPFLALLWEEGRISAKEIQILPGYFGGN